MPSVHVFLGPYMSKNDGACYRSAGNMWKFSKFMSRLSNCVDSVQHVDSIVLMLSDKAVAIDL